MNNRIPCRLRLSISRHISHISSPPPIRIASGNNTNKSESDQEDNDDVNDNDWSYGAEKKGERPVISLLLDHFEFAQHIKKNNKTWSLACK